MRPPAYEQDLAARDAQFRKQAQVERGAMNQRRALAAAAPASAGAFFAGSAKKAASYRSEQEGKEAEQATDQLLDLRQGVQSMATAANVGELFQYVIATPVSLSRHESAMLPILNGDVKAEKVSIYNPAVQPKYPLAGLWLTNSTELHLMQGPITLFDGDSYAGDAKIEDLTPGSRRLLSHAVDLDTEVAPESKGGPEQLVTVRLVKGLLIADRKSQRTQQYTIKNSGRKAKKVLVEVPLEPAWTLIAPKEPAEKTRDMVRFLVEAKPGVPAKLAVEEERVDRQQFLLTNLDDNSIRIYAGAKVVGEKVKIALAEVLKRKQALLDVANKRGQLEQQIRTIADEQSRIRENMGRLDHNTDLYKRYVKKLADQEDEVDRLRGQIKDLADQENQLRKSLDEYLLGLDL